VFQSGLQQLLPADYMHVSAWANISLLARRRTPSRDIVLSAAFRMMARMRTVFIAFLALVVSVSAQAQNQPAPASPPPPTTSSSWPTTQFAATAAKDPSVQKAKQVLDDMISALGGDAYLNIHTMSMEGRSYSFWQGKPSGMGLVFWRFWEWPDKDRWELTKDRDVIELNIGDKGYEITYKGTATQDPKQLDDYPRRRDHALETVVRQWLAAPGTIILYAGTAIVEQTLTDEVTVFNAENDSVTISVDPHTHLPVRKMFSYRDPIDRLKDDDAELFSNYRVVQGISTPYSVVRMQNGEMRNQRFINNVSYNTELAPTLFQTKGITYNPQKQASSQPQKQNQ